MTREEAEKYAENMTYREAICNLKQAKSVPYRKATFIKINELLNELEQESRKGHWIEHEESISTAFKHLRECSCCKCYFDWLMPRNSFCPNCGADMREVKE